MQGVYEKLLAVGCRCLETFAHIYYIAVYILVYHIPWSACKSQPFALAYGMVPITFVSPDDVAGFFFYYQSFAFAEVAAYQFVVVYLAKEAYSLAVFPVGRRNMCFVCYAANIVFL